LNGKLYLIPNVLNSETVETIPAYITDIIAHIDVFIVESLKNARRHLVKIGVKNNGRTVDQLTFFELDKHAKEGTLTHYLQAALEGKNIGLLSDAGCPAVADPGSSLIAAAHRKGIEVVPLVGPSSIILALMGSGMSGQSFAFVGYLPIDSAPRKQRLTELEKRAQRENQTQLFIETPYRNQQILADILAACQPAMRLCIATDITLPTQSIQTRSIEQWRKNPPTDLHKRPVVFALGK
jgi:16S rRNA (cytidine1402-2'-O)-methyltransferase